MANKVEITDNVCCQNNCVSLRFSQLKRGVMIGGLIFSGHANCVCGIKPLKNGNKSFSRQEIL